MTDRTDAIVAHQNESLAILRRAPKGEARGLARRASDGAPPAAPSGG
jgi:hypothetical protein